MPPTVALLAGTLDYPEGAGHQWVFLNWALGLRGHGCDVIWIEGVDPQESPVNVRRWVGILKARLAEYGITDRVALCSTTGEPLPPALTVDTLPLDDARGADLLLNLTYAACPGVPALFRRTALLDIDPGLLQVWLHEGHVALEPHDLYFTIGETVGQPGCRFPTGGIDWLYTPPCIATDTWTVGDPPGDDAPFTTVSTWETSKEWVIFGEESYHNDKKSGFLPFLDLPRHTSQPLELALCLRADEHLNLMPDEEEEKRDLERRGWRVIHAHSVAATPLEYQRYIQRSKGEFSGAKPSCVRLQNAWVSDRTLCYLASGRPAVVRHTGPSRFLPDDAGLFRFHTLGEAAHYLDRVAEDYERQSRLARELAVEHFDARKVAGKLLERALP